MTQERPPGEMRLRRRAESKPPRDAQNGAPYDPIGADPGGLRGLLTSRQRSRAAAAAAHAEQQRAEGRAMGDRLRETRTGLALSLAEVERDIRINRAYLEALEAGRFDTLPAPVYARGFMRSYARYLGIDPEEAAAAIPRDLPRPAGLEPLTGLRRLPAPGLSMSLSQFNLPMLLVAALAIVAIIAAVVLVPRIGGGDGIDLPLGRGEAPGASTPTTSPTPPAAQGPPAVATIPPFTPGTVPNFSGVQRDEAVRVLEEAGLVPLIFEAPNDAPAGSVFQQSPPPGQSIEDGGTVTLFVSQGSGG